MLPPRTGWALVVLLSLCSLPSYWRGGAAADQPQSRDRGDSWSETSPQRSRLTHWRQENRLRLWRLARGLAGAGRESGVRSRVADLEAAGRDAGLALLVFSLYGSDERYTDGAVANANLFRSVYPGWGMRVYHDNTVPAAVLRQLTGSGVELVNMTGSPLNRMTWRFTAASDERVGRFCCRDIDSRLSSREHAAVSAWRRSGRKFHVMRDHPSHSRFSMSGGLWCGTADALPGMAALLRRHSVNESYFADMRFLDEVVWPHAQASVLQHDAFSCESWGGGFPFPTRRQGWDNVGSVYVRGKPREKDMHMLRTTPAPLACQESDECPCPRADDGDEARQLTGNEACQLTGNEACQLTGNEACQLTGNEANQLTGNKTCMLTAACASSSPLTPPARLEAGDDQGL